VLDEYRTARGACAAIASRAARRALSAHTSSFAAIVRHSRGRAAAATSTDAPARRSDATSSASASRNPAVPPSDTISTSIIGLTSCRAWT
jgi:hypothetical protein